MKTSREEAAIDGQLRKAVVLNEYGEPSEQKDALVNTILAMFQDPDRWPLDDVMRIHVLKTLYRMAQNIRITEQACANCK
jgi:hypothetical protein